MGRTWGGGISTSCLHCSHRFLRESQLCFSSCVRFQPLCPYWCSEPPLFSPSLSLRIVNSHWDTHPSPTYITFFWLSLGLNFIEHISQLNIGLLFKSTCMYALFDIRHACPCWFQGIHDENPCCRNIQNFHGPCFVECKSMTSIEHSRGKFEFILAWHSKLSWFVEEWQSLFVLVWECMSSAAFSSGSVVVQYRMLGA